MNSDEVVKEYLATAADEKLATLLRENEKDEKLSAVLRELEELNG